MMKFGGRAVSAAALGIALVWTMPATAQQRGQLKGPSVKADDTKERSLPDKSGKPFTVKQRCAQGETDTSAWLECHAKSKPK